MVEYDDIFVSRSNLRKLIVERWQQDCSQSRVYANLWIHEADGQGKIKIFHHPNGKPKNLVCLASLFEHFKAPMPPISMDTSREESLVEKMLFDNNGWIEKRKVISMLKNLPRMDSPWNRNQVFLNAAQYSRFFVGKDPFGQVVALQKEDIPMAIEKMREQKIG